MAPNQGTSTRRNVAATSSATNFVKVVRALLRNPPRGSTTAATATVPVPVPEAEEEGSNEVATGQFRKDWEPRRRTALDISGHRFAKNLQAEIGGARNRRQQQPVVSEPADSDEESLLKLKVGKRPHHPTTQRQQQQQQQQPMFFDVPEEDRGIFSSSSALLKEGVGRAERADWDNKPSPRSSRASSSSSSTSTLPPSPDAAGVTAAAARPRSELPPLVPKTRSRCTAGTCRRQQPSRAAYFA